VKYRKILDAAETVLRSFGFDMLYMVNLRTRYGNYRGTARMNKIKTYKLKCFNNKLDNSAKDPL
jgi:hypothetical protein